MTFIVQNLILTGARSFFCQQSLAILYHADMNIREISCDTVVIGAGTAGLEAYRAAAEGGADCVLADGGKLGTTAQRSGELPASYLMNSALAVRELQSFRSKGLLIQDPEVETSGVLGMVRAMRSRATSSVLSFLYRIPEEKRLHGMVSFEDPHTLMVGDTCRVHFKTAVIATGTQPLITYEQAQLKNVITTNEFYEQEKLPSSAAVFGSTAVGLQLGQALSYLGVDVTVFGQRMLWELSDEEVLSCALNSFSSRFNLAVDSFITSIEPEEHGYSIYYIDGGKYENYLYTTEVIAASARIPNVGGLNLQHIGVKLTREGYIRTEPNTMQTSVKHIFAAGSVKGSVSTAQAEAEGRYAGMNAARPDHLMAMPETVNLQICYTDPVLAIAGRGFEAMKKWAYESGGTFIAARASFGDTLSGNGHHQGGILALYVDKESHRIMGAELCAREADHLAQFLAFAIRKRTLVEELLDFNFVHLTGEEVLSRAAADAVQKLTGRSGYQRLLQP